MSVLIESTDELLTLLKKLNLKVGSVDELRQLLASINASYNPEAARQKTGKLVGTAVPGGVAAAAAITSFFLIGSGQSTPGMVGSLALIWGACAAVSLGAILASFLMTRPARGRSAEVPPESPGPVAEPAVTNIFRQLP